MSDYEMLIRMLGLTVVGVPTLLFSLLGLSLLAGRPFAEATTVIRFIAAKERFSRNRNQNGQSKTGL